MICSRPALAASQAKEILFKGNRQYRCTRRRCHLGPAVQCSWSLCWRGTAAARLDLPRVYRPEVVTIVNSGCHAPTELAKKDAGGGGLPLYLSNSCHEPSRGRYSSMSSSPEAVSIKLLMVDVGDVSVRPSIVLKKELGIEVIGTATSFAETIALTAALKPDVLLMDPHMPDEREYTPELVKSQILLHTKCIVTYVAIERR